MSIKNCDFADRTIQELKLAVNNKQSRVGLNVDTTFPVSESLKEIFNTVVEDLKNRFNTKTISLDLLSRELGKHIDTSTKKGKEDLLKAIHIFYIQFYAMNDDAITSVFLEHQRKHALKSPEVKNLALEGAVGEIDLNKMTLNKVKILFKLVQGMAINKMSKNPDKWHEGFFGAIRIALKPSAMLTVNDPTGAISISQKSIDSYFADIETTVGALTGGDLINLLGQGTERNYGTNDIYKNLEKDIEHIEDMKGDEEFSNKIKHLFYWINQGWIEIVNGKILINKHYGKMPDGKGGVLKHSNTGKVIKGYHTPMKIEKYVNGDGLNAEDKNDFDKGIDSNPTVGYRLKIKDLFVKLKDESIAVLEREHARMQKITDLMHEWIVRESTNADDAIHKAIFPYFKRTPKHLFIKFLFTEKDSKEFDKLLNKIKAVKGITQEEIDTILYLKDLGPLQGAFSDSDFEKKEGTYAPSLYSSLKQMIRQLPRIIRELKGSLEIATKDEVAEIEGALDWAERLHESLSSEDFEESTSLIGNAAVNIYGKHITGAFDLRDAIDNPTTWKNYITNEVTVVMKKRMMAEQIRALLLARKHKNEFIESYIVNNVLQISNDPNVESGIGNWRTGFKEWLHGSLFDQALTTFLGSPVLWVGKTMQFRKIGEKRIFRMLKRWQKLPTATMLYGPFSGIQNRGANIIKSIIAGPDWRKAQESYKGETEEGLGVIKDVIDASGMLKFNDFFVESLQNTFSSVEFSPKTVLIMLKKISEGKKRIDNGESRQAVEKDLVKIIGQEIELLGYSEEAIEKMRVEAKLQRKEEVVANLVNAAISRVFAHIERMSPTLKQAWYKNIIDSIQVNSWKAMDRVFTTNILKNYSMGTTEEQVRTQTAIYTIYQFNEMGYFSTKKIEDWNEDDKKSAIDVLRQMLLLLDYAMSPTSLGMMSKGQIGSLNSKFKGWTIQHIFTEIDLLKSWADVLEDHLNSEKNRGTLNSIFNNSIAMVHDFMRMVISKKGKSFAQIRKENPEGYAAVAYWLPSVFISVVITLFPYANIFNRIAAITFGGKQGRGLISGFSNKSADILIFFGLLAYFMGGGGDEDDKEDFLLYGLRALPINGYYTGMTVLIMLMMYGFADDDKSLIEKTTKQATRQVPGGEAGTTIFGWVADLFKDIF